MYLMVITQQFQTNAFFFSLFAHPHPCSTSKALAFSALTIPSSFSDKWYEGRNGLQQDRIFLSLQNNSETLTNNHTLQTAIQLVEDM